jgi:CBS domain-containing protein
MKAIDVMTVSVVSVDAETSVQTVAKLLAEHRISAVPVVDRDKTILGIVSEGDLLRRAEIGTERGRRSWWLEAVASNKQLANEYAKSHARKAKDVMTRDVVTVTEAAPLSEVADLLESHGIKRVPVVRNGKLVGIVSRANLIQALASMRDEPAEAEVDDRTIREKLLAELKAQKWAEARPGNVVVHDRVVHLWGDVLSDAEKRALRVAAEGIAGVREVEDHTTIYAQPLVPGV